MKTILPLLISNVFMTFARYGHLRHTDTNLVWFALIVLAVFFIFRKW